MKNTLAYYDTELMIVKESLIEQAVDVNVTNKPDCLSLSSLFSLVKSISCRWTPVLLEYIRQLETP